MKIYTAVLIILGWFALIAQFCITINTGIVPVPETILRYFSYFTILTNLLAVICCTTIFIVPSTGIGRFFSKPQTQAAIGVYILVVGLTYNLILRFIWAPTGLQRIVDELLHVGIPIMFLIYWFLFSRKDLLQWKDIWSWLVFPFIYLLVIMIRGAFSGFYPYPFIDAVALGFSKALANAAYIALVFIAISFLFVWVGKMAKK